MARKLRIEFPRALYHVINRGNYRRDVFASEGAADAFVEALAECVARNQWKLYAYVVMRNHFHLVIETSEANLSLGMHWLLSTIATRFNRFRNERGHLFQGRFHGLLIEDYRVLGHVVDYVHLNPVRAKVVEVGGASWFKWSSLHRFVQGDRFPGLDASGALGGRGWDDTKPGWRGYLDHLSELADNQEAQRRLGYDGFSNGWAIGSNDWKRNVAKDHAQQSLIAGLVAEEAAAVMKARWNLVYDDLLGKLGWTRGDVVRGAKTAAWKLQLALEIRATAGASIAWLARELRLGTAGTARSHLSRLRRQQK